MADCACRVYHGATQARVQAEPSVLFLPPVDMKASVTIPSVALHLPQIGAFSFLIY